MTKNVGNAFLLVWRLPLSREELVQWSHLNWKVQQLSRADEIAIEKDIQEMKADEADAIERAGRLYGLSMGNHTQDEVLE